MWGILQREVEAKISILFALFNPKIVNFEYVSLVGHISGRRRRRRRRTNSQIQTGWSAAPDKEEATPEAGPSILEAEDAEPCAVCLEEPRCALLVPCGHVAMLQCVNASTRPLGRVAMRQCGHAAMWACGDVEHGQW